MKQSFLYKVSVLFLVFIASVHSLSAQCMRQVTNLSGTTTINGVAVTVTSSGKVWSSNFYCSETLPYFIGVNSGAISGTGSYSFNFSPPIDSLKLNFSGISVGTNAYEVVVLKKNAVHYSIPQVGVQNICDDLAVLTASGDIEACPGCNLSGWKGTIVQGPISSLQVIDSVLPAIPGAGGSLFSLFIYVPCTTPVAFVSCEATKKGNQSLLTWQTSFEQNNLQYEINRSADGENFIKIGTVQSNNSSLGGSYVFLDENPLPGVNYYRIDSRDFDNKITSCRINTVRFPSQKNEINIYPIPTTGKLIIENNSSGKNLNIEIRDISGKTVLKTTKTNNFRVDLSVEQLPKGVYILAVFFEDHIAYKKMVKM